MIFKIISCVVFIYKIFIFSEMSFCKEKEKILISLNWENVTFITIIFNSLLANKKILSQQVSNIGVNM